MSTRLFNRNFFLLWQGQLVSHLGSQAFLVAIMYWTMEATGSASLMGIVMMLSTLPMVVLSPFGGTLADWYARRTIIIVSDGLSGVSVLSLAGLMLWCPEAPDITVMWLCGVVVLNGCVRAFFQPAITAAIPDLVAVERVASANSMMQFSGQVSTFVGQGLGGLLYRLLGAPVLFLVDGLSYLFSAISEAFITLPRGKRQAATSPRAAFKAFWGDTKAGFQYVWHHVGMRTLLLAASTVNFFIMPVFVLLPFYVQDQLGAGAAWYGFLLAALGAGSVLGYLVAGGLKLAGQRRSVVLIGCFFGAAVLIGVLGMVAHRIVALGLLLTVGVLSGLINIYVLTLFQIRTPPAMRGRVMSLVITLASAVTPLGMLLGGVLGDATAKNLPLLFAVCGAGATVVLLFTTQRRAFRAFLAAPLHPSEAD